MLSAVSCYRVFEARIGALPFSSRLKGSRTVVYVYRAQRYHAFV